MIRLMAFFAHPRASSVFLVLAFLVYLFAWPGGPYMDDDTADYLVSAADLADGRIDSLLNRLPGYPLLLMLVGYDGQPNRLLYIIQLLAHFGGLFLLLRLARDLGLSRAIIRTFLAVGCLPLYLGSVAYALSETLAGFFLVLALYALVQACRSQRLAHFALAGFALACLPFIRPTYLALFFLPLLFALRPGFGFQALRNPRHLALVLLPPLLLVLAYIGFNKTRFNYPGMTPLLGFNLSTRTWNALGRIPDRQVKIRELLIRKRDIYMADGVPIQGYFYIWQHNTIEELQQITGLDRAGLSQYMMRLNLELIARAPYYYMREVVFGAANFWLPYMPATTHFGFRSLKFSWVVFYFVAMFLFWLPVLLFLGASLAFLFFPNRRTAFAGIMARFSNLWPAWLLIMGFVLYTNVISCTIDVGLPRYRAPLDLLILFATALGWDTIRRIRQADQQS